MPPGTFSNEPSDRLPGRPENLPWHLKMAIPRGASSETADRCSCRLREYFRAALHAARKWRFRLSCPNNRASRQPLRRRSSVRVTGLSGSHLGIDRRSKPEVFSTSLAETQGLFPLVATITRFKPGGGFARSIQYFANGMLASSRLTDFCVELAAPASE
eukprot:1175198-Pyramimonas_sp.AAC.1